MSSAVKSLAECEKTYMIKLRQQYNESQNFQNAKVAAECMTFKTQQHQDCFDDLMEAWEEYREDNGAEEEMSEDENKNLPGLPEMTKQRTTDEPETVETLILERHVYEMLYNILLASHYQMKQRKSKLLNEIHEQVTVKKTKKKRTDIVNKYLPTNEKTMRLIINHIFDDIVGKHYKKSKLFTEIKKQRIIQFIKESCVLSFEMLLAYNELSFFPLLFTDQSSSYISPVVRYDRVIKKNEKNNKSASLDESQFLQIIKQNKAEKGFTEGRHRRSYSSLKASQILYYTFPGVIVTAKDKVLEKAETFTHDDPSIFLRHDLNWLFSDSVQRGKKIDKFIRHHSLPEDEASDDVFSPASEDTDPYHGIQAIPQKLKMTMDDVKQSMKNETLKNQDFISKAQLIQDWGQLKRQQYDELCEELCGLIEEMDEDEDQDDDDDDSKCGDEESEDEEDPEFEYNRIASQLLVELTFKCRQAMELKLRGNSLGDDKDNMTFLNMSAIYKYFTNKDNDKDSKQRIDIKHGYIVKRIVNSCFEQVIDNNQDKKYKKYTFLKQDEKLKQKLHEYIALCCQLICNIFHYQWDLCPEKISNDQSGNKSKSLIKFDGRIHIKDNELSMDGSSTKIAYCVFPGIILKSSWNQFDSQFSKNQLNEEQIAKFLQVKIWTCLNDDE